MLKPKHTSSIWRSYSWDESIEASLTDANSEVGPVLCSDIIIWHYFYIYHENFKLLHLVFEDKVTAWQELSSCSAVAAQNTFLISESHQNLFLLRSHFIIISAQMHIDALIRRSVFTMFSRARAHQDKHESVEVKVLLIFLMGDAMWSYF